MKKNILILLLISIACILSTQSQAKEILLLDSVIIQSKIDKQAEKVTFDYDAHGLMCVQTDYRKENAQTIWSPNWKSEKSYYNESEISAISSSFNKETNTWDEISKSETQYTNGVQTVAYLRESGNWVPVLKSENWDNSLIRLSLWQNNQWIWSDQYETNFNSHNYATLSTSSAWNETSGIWEQNTHTESTFDDNGKLVVSVICHNNKNLQAIHIQYDEGNHPSSENRYQWDYEAMDWIESLKIEYSYDAKNRLIEVTESQWVQSINFWRNIEKTEYQYTGNDTFPKTAILYTGAVDTWIPKTEFSYFYSNHLVDVTVDTNPEQPQMQLRIYPNPVGDWFHVLGLTDNAILNILNTNGKSLIHQNIEEDEAVSTQSLSKGVYIVTIQVGEVVVSQKIIKK